jgi:uncharacterized protein (DUF1697 family)
MSATRLKTQLTWHSSHYARDLGLLLTKGHQRRCGRARVRAKSDKQFAAFIHFPAPSRRLLCPHTPGGADRPAFAFRIHEITPSTHVSLSHPLSCSTLASDMTTYIALLRAVNVGGTGKLPMADLKALCAELGFRRVETYIASGNVVFDSDMVPAKVQAQLEQRLLAYAGKSVGVFVRTTLEMRTILKRNPFSDKESNLTHAIFLNGKPPAGALDDVRGRTREEMRLGQREIYVYYPEGMGQSKLQIPAAKLGTARNMNTVAKLLEMSSRA